MKSDGTWEVVTFPTLNPWERREASEVRSRKREREREESEKRESLAKSLTRPNPSPPGRDNL
jgi:hypothetical protein